MKKLLYIDDDKEQLELYRLAFGIHSPNIEFHTENNPHKAIDRIREIKPDIVLLDLLLTDMSGIDVLKAIRKEDDIKSTMVAAFTNSMVTNLVNELNQLGVTEIWEKIKSTPMGFAKRTNQLLGL
jgi:CheY-like chemotaxis protein